MSAETAEAETAKAEVPEADAPGRETPEAETPDTDAPALMHPAPGISRVDATAPLSEPANSAAMDSVVEDPETGSREPTDLLPAESPKGLDTWQSGARHRQGAGALVCVSDLLPASALSAGRSGRRRAEEPLEEPSDGTPTAEVRRIGDAPPVTRQREGTGTVPSEDTEDSPPTRGEFPASGPPPAPTPRVLEWEPEGAGPTGEGESGQMGLGDLLAEALAAYQQGRAVRTDDRGPTRPRDDGGVTAADAGHSRDAPRYRSPGTRWMSGLQLAPPIDRPQGDPSEALTNPLLRLPDLTAEPQWIPPETGRQSAAGD